MQISTLTFMGFYLNGALGSGKYNDISIKEVKERIRSHSIFDFLHGRLGMDVDLSILTPDEKQELNDEWEDMADNVDEARKMCVDNNGLCLIVAYLLEGIQRRTRIKQ